MLLKNLSNTKILSVLSYLAMAALIAFFLVDRYVPNLQVGQRAPMDDKILSLAGIPSSFKSFSGKKVLVVNFWATWCPPCQKELPILSKIAAKYASSINFVGATVDSPKETIVAMKARYSLNYWIGAVDSSVVSNWHAQILPTTYIIDKGGAIIWAKTGALSEEALESAINMALKK